MDENDYNELDMEKTLKAEKLSSQIIVPLISNIVKIRGPNPKILDIGCGPGHFANEFKYLFGDDVEVTAIDISNFSKQFLLPEVEFIQYDLTRPLELKNKYDVVLCLEVIEHIDEKYEDIICKSIVDCAKNTIILSIAVPGQEGKEHVNLKPLEYWVKKFTDLGLVYRHDLRIDLTKQLKRIGSHLIPFYFINNMLVFNVPESFNAMDGCE